MSTRSKVLVIASAIAFATLAACVTTKDTSRPTNDKEAAVANVKLGVAYMQQGNLNLAKEKLERAEKQDPKNLEAHTALAFLYERLNTPEEAEREYQAALRLQPDSADVANNYAVFLCRSGKVDQAIRLFETAARDQLYRTPWAAYTNAAVCLRANKRTAEAAPYLERALGMRPDYAEAVMELGDLQLELGHPDLASNVVDRYLALGRVSADVLLVGVRAALARGDRAGAENYARRLRRDFPNTAAARALTQVMPGQNPASSQTPPASGQAPPQGKK